MSDRRRIAAALLGATLHLAVLIAWVALAAGVDGLGRASSWLVMLAATLLAAAEASSQQRDDRVVHAAPELATGVLLLGMVAAAAVLSGPWSQTLVGLGLVSLGVALRVAAMRALGVGFSTRPRRDDRLVVRGVYRWARHPSELGLLAFAAGLAVLSGHAALALSWLALALLVGVRLLREDAALALQHGAAQQRYATRVGWFAPRLRGPACPPWRLVSLLATLSIAVAAACGSDADEDDDGDGDGGSGAGGTTAPSASSSGAGASGGSGAMELPPANAPLDYQLGGAYPPPSGVQVLSRDRGDAPEPGLYNICYVNGFQAQPDESSWWLSEHPDLVLRDSGGNPVIDPDWNEMLLDVSTAAKRDALAVIVGEWIAGCASDGYQAAEIDNLDSYSRSQGLLMQDHAVSFMTLLSAAAHAQGLAIAQKNSTELLARRGEMGTDFAVAEECNRWVECSDYVAAYGDLVFVIEYRQQDFDKGCSDFPNLSVVLRDLNLVTAGSAGYVYDGC